ncbi:MAG: hypothetical protein WCS96_06865 [Victivallales bacterium]
MIFSPPGPEQWIDQGIALNMLPEEGFIQNFTCTAESTDGINWTLWYSSHAEGKMNIAVAEGVPGHGMKRFPAALFPGKASDARLSIGNLPEGWYPVQPVYLKLPDGRHRIYFWAHSWDQGVVRYLCADSRDGRRFEVLDPCRPCLYHYNDRAVPAALFGPAGLTFGKRAMPRPAGEPEANPELLSNDATNVYMLPDGTFEMFTVHISHVEKDDPRYIAHDNAAGWIRVIYRRTSNDGITWSAGEQVIAPDADDPSCLQFYYLAVAHLPEGRVGLLGHYNVQAQTMDIEWCFSADGIHWERPARVPWLPRNPEQSGVHGIYAPHAPVKINSKWHLFYTACNFTHNHSLVSGKEKIADIRLAEINALIISPKKN